MVQNNAVEEFMENKLIQGLSALAVQFSDNGEWVKRSELSIHKQRYYDSLHWGLQDELITDKENYTLINVMKHPYKQGVIYRINEYCDTNESRVVELFQKVKQGR